VRFSARIASELNSEVISELVFEVKFAGDPTMSALSLWQVHPPSA